MLGLPDVLRQRAMAELGDLERGALIGRGSFGRVYKGRWRGASPEVGRRACVSGHAKFGFVEGVSLGKVGALRQRAVAA